MATQVPDITTLRKRAVQLLREEDRYMTTSEISLALGMPYWATDAAMEHAFLAREATFEAGAGWMANAVPDRSSSDVADGQGVLS